MMYFTISARNTRTGDCRGIAYFTAAHASTVRAEASAAMRKVDPSSTWSPPARICADLLAGAASSFHFKTGSPDTSLIVAAEDLTYQPPTIASVRLIIEAGTNSETHSVAAHDDFHEILGAAVRRAGIDGLPWDRQASINVHRNLSHPANPGLILGSEGRHIVTVIRADCLDFWRSMNPAPAA